MSFEMNGITYDPSRKGSAIQTFKAINPSDNTKINKVFMPVPYNLAFNLNIIAKLNDDALQIIEQILPFFQPAFNVTVDLVSSIGEKRDIPIVLNTITFTDNYEGDFTERRYLIYTLNFTAKTNLFGPVVDSTNALIKKVKTDFYTDTNRLTAKWEEIREFRNQLLLECDWTQLADIPSETKVIWSEYRQSLRDITSQTNPFSITWPVKP